MADPTTPCSQRKSKNFILLNKLAAAKTPSRSPSPRVTRSSLRSAPQIVVTPRDYRSVRRSQPQSQAGSEEYNLGTIDTSEGETLESLTAKLKELSLEVKETRRENVELKGEVKETRRENEELKEKIENIYVINSKHEDALENIKCQLESQRLEFKEEIRRVMALKDPVRKSKDGNVQTSHGTCEGCGKEFKRLEQHWRLTSNQSCRGRGTVRP